MHRFLILILFLFLLTACSLMDPLSRAQRLSDNGKFKESIKILEKEYKANPNSVPVKSLLAQAYSNYGIALCQDSSKLPREKYPLAKEQFSMALVLNPYLKDAMEMYETIVQIQESLKENKLN